MYVFNPGFEIAKEIQHGDGSGFVVRNEADEYLTPAGRWSKYWTEAMVFEDAFEAEDLISKLSTMLPTFSSLNSKVKVIYW